MYVCMLALIDNMIVAIVLVMLYLLKHRLMLRSPCCLTRINLLRIIVLLCHIFTKYFHFSCISKQVALNVIVLLIKIYFIW